VATLANLLKRGLQMSLPVVVRGDGRQLFRDTERPDNLILFLHIQFEISNRQIAGYVALLMDIPSIDHLRALISDYVSNIS
jgi:chemotaxis protein CheC